MARQRIGRRKRKLCAGDLDKRITLHRRTFQSPQDGEVSGTEKFDQSSPAFAKIDTFTGKVLFDGVGADQTVTHVIYIRHRLGVSTETWVEFRKDLYDILTVEDIDERNEWLRLSCRVRGPKTSQAAHA